MADFQVKDGKKKNFREITRYHVLHSDELGWSWDWPHP